MNAYHAFRSLKRKRRGENQRFAYASGSGRPHKGFTLIELLVVMAIMASLAALMIAFFPNAASAQREARAATLLQSWLNIAKQRALRDQAPRGVRLWINSNYYSGPTLLPTVVTDCQYIEQPPDYPSASGIQATFVSTNTAKNISTIAFFSGVPPLPLDLSNGNPTGPMQYWSVQTGDYFQIGGNGLMHQITGVLPTPPSPVPNSITVTPPLANSFAPTANWRIMRSPRVVGDETLAMPDSTLIDLNTNLVTYAGVLNSALPPPENNDPTSDTAAGYVDILFAPNGAVISRGVSTNVINLWVRSPSQDSAAAAANALRGDPTIVSVFVKTGLVGAYPPDPNGANPYAFVK